MPDAVLRIRAGEPIGRISPRLYGHFAEHLGRCCYDGLWVGPDRDDAGFGARSALGTSALPGNIPVEIECIVEVA